MPRIDPVWATVSELSRAFGARTLSPVDAVEALLDRIRRRDPALHAFIAVYEADARLAAEGADRAIRSGHRVGPLHGVPIALKDLVDLEGRVTTGGSKVWAERVSPVTATLAERLIAAGMIILGKTHTVEFAMGSWGTNTHLGTPRNPWDLTVHRTPGGSSSGSGVAVAAGLAPVAIGTDTGGSGRPPPARGGGGGAQGAAGGPAGPRDAPLGAARPAARAPARRRRPAPGRPARRRARRRGRRGARRLRRCAHDARRARRADRPPRAAAPPERLRRGRRADHRRRGLPLRRPPRGRHEPAHRPAHPPADPAGAGRVGARLPADARRAGGAPAGLRRGARRRRRAADADDADGGDSPRRDRPVRHRRALHQGGGLPPALPPPPPRRLHRGRPAHVAPDPLPRRRGGDGAAHRLGLRAGERLEGAPPPPALTPTSPPSSSSFFFFSFSFFF